MAYDDGSAETAYGFTGIGTKKFAYEFDLHKPDTLAGFQFMFTQIQDNVLNLVFDFNVWDTLQLGSYTFVDSPIVDLINQLPFYIDSTNGYATYVLDTPIPVSNKIYIGWAQDDTRSLQLGFDENSPLGRNHMFAYLNGAWDSSSLSAVGSPMIRAIFTGHYPGHSSNVAGINHVVQDLDKLSIYPNPTSGILYLSSSRSGAVYDVDINNMLGEEVEHASGVSTHLNIAKLANAVYILTARDQLTGQVFRQKIVKTSN
jgi:hypothetical protein